MPENALTEANALSDKTRRVSQKSAKTNKSVKAQSAMEYLMTYGWAILIIAVVLGALFSLGLFSASSFIGSSCIAQSGFYCAGVTLSTSGGLQLTIGQATGTTFTNTKVLFVPFGANLSQGASAVIGTLTSGEEYTVTLQLPTIAPFPSSYALGTPITGYIYLTYTNVYGTQSTTEVATITTKVTSTAVLTLQQAPVTVPSGIQSYVPITLTNSQTTATPAPFQQMVQFPESTYQNYLTYNGNIANFEFFTSSGAIIPAWIESNSSGTITAWLNLASGINPGSANAITVYLGFASKTTNLLSSSGTTGIGEAPQLSSTYAQYDDGASVFSFYNNFAGTTLSPLISTASGITATQNNGLQLAVSTVGDTFYTMINQQETTPFIFESLVTAQNAGGSSNFQEGLVIDSNTIVGQNTGGQPGGTNYMFRLSNHGPYYNIYEGSTLLASSTPSAITYPYTSMESFQQNATGLTAIDNGNKLTASTTALTSGYIGFYTYSTTTGNSQFIQYVRTRAYPPNGVMPSVSFGSVS
ncbi:MAG: hypothetical protein QW257_01275 [Candidatus Micrarchaeaceae archaeon]